MSKTTKNRQCYRHREYDYGSVGWYFITINTANFSQLFGKIENREMHLNQFGIIAQKEWLKTEQIRDNVTLEEFVIMPDHFHAIISIDYPKNQDNLTGVFRSTSHTLGSIVRGYKGAVTKQLKIYASDNQIEDFPSKIWQRNYYDRIIRDEKELYNVKNYILENPKRYRPRGRRK